MPEEILAGSKRTESNVSKTTKEGKSAKKTEPSPSVAGFKPFRINSVNPSFQPAISVRLVNWMILIPISELRFNLDPKKL